MKLKDLQKDEFAKTVIKRSSGTDRHLYLLRALKRLEQEKERVDDIGGKLAKDFVESGKGFDFNDPRAKMYDKIITIGRVDQWKSIYTMVDEIPPQLAAFCEARTRRSWFLSRQIKQVKRFLKGIQGANTRKERQERLDSIRGMR